MRHIALAIALALSLTTQLPAAEGKWTPQQVLELDPAWLKVQGLEIPPARLWDPQQGTGLLAATIHVGGCSGGFVSSDGLFITNHHCLFGVLQEHATPENDIITNGYLARTRDGELKSGTLRVTWPRRFIDVTKEILAAIPPKATDAARFRAIEDKEKAIVAQCEKQPATRCSVAGFDGGVQYVLQEMNELSDVRLVYAPPRSVGEYGGEIDNWMWPRHTGDFSIGRVYTSDGQPFHPEFWFPISSRGIDDGDFVMVLGYPGITYRSLTVAEVEERVSFFEARQQIYGEWIRLLEEATKGHPDGVIAVADTLKSLQNRFKNAEGQLAGFARGNILEKRRAGDRAVLAWAADHPAAAGAVPAYSGLADLAGEKKSMLTHDFLLGDIEMTARSLGKSGPKALVFAATIARAALERGKPDAKRQDLFTLRSIDRTRERLVRDQKSLFVPADKALFGDFVRRALALPPDQKIQGIDRLFAGADAERSIEDRIDDLYEGTKLLDLDERLKMFEETAGQLHARHDPLVELGFDLASAMQTTRDREDRWNGTISRLRPQWRRAVIAHAGKPVAPDANSTLRVSFAHVKGYSPRDAVWYLPQTSLSGVVEKNTGEDPFDTPAAVLSAAREARAGQWVDEQLADVPVDFLSDADTTGGNSGSPTVNGRGEIVGVNFDRVWENVANDFGYNPEIARNVNVDVRYLLWMLEEIEKASELLKELGVAHR